MTASILGLVLLVAAAAVATFYHRERVRRRLTERLDAIIRMPHTGASAEGVQPRFATRPFPPRYRVVPLLIGLVTLAGLSLGAGLPLEVAAAAGSLLGVLGNLLEEYVANRRVATIEAQLSDAIDLLVGSLRAGAALLAAFESSLREAREPLRSYLEEVVGRIRLGDDPRVVIGELPERIPLETFRLFAVSLAVHWDVGGSLASTLATVGRTIRDRIELSRRVQAQAIEANVSVAAVMGIAYVLAVLMWRANPDRMEAFASTGVGSDLIAAVITLQAVGLIWMSKISRSAF